LALIEGARQHGISTGRLYTCRKKGMALVSEHSLADPAPAFLPAVAWVGEEGASCADGDLPIGSDDRGPSHRRGEGAHRLLHARGDDRCNVEGAAIIPIPGQDGVWIAKGHTDMRPAMNTLPLALQSFDVRVREAEMVRDLLDQHVADKAEQVLSGLDPLQQDGPAVEGDGVVLHRRVENAILRPRSATVEPGKRPGALEAEVLHRLFICHLLHHDSNAPDQCPQLLWDGGEGLPGQVRDIVEGGGMVEAVHGVSTFRWNAASSGREMADQLDDV
jgi:hypothetical protein